MGPADVDPATAAPPEQLQIAVLDVSQARLENARDMADARLAAETQAGGGVRGFVRSIWKGNLAREYYRQKYTHQARNEIDASGNLYAGEEGVDSREAVGSVVDRFTHDYADEMLHQGEKRHEVEDGRDNGMRTAVENLIGSFAREELNEGSFEEEKNRVLKELAKQNPAVFGKGIAFADNLLEVAKNVKAQIAHGKGLDEVMASAKMVVGEARMGVRTEAKFSRVDKIVDKLHSTRIGSLVNESTLATAAAIVVGVTKWGAQRTTGAALAATGAIGASGAVLGAVRESKRFKEERSQHMRESAMGKSFDAEAKRRAKLEETRYETKGASELSAGLKDLVDETGKAREIANPQQYIEAVKKVAEAHARIKMSDREKIDLIHYSDVAEVEKERFDLDLALAQAKVALRKELDDKGADTLLPPGLKTSTFDQLLASYDQTFVTGQETQINQRDTVFNKMRRAQVAKAALQGLAIGAVVGTAVQEGMAHLPGVGDNYYGLGETPSAENMTEDHHSTLLRGIFQGNENRTVVSSAEGMQSLAVSDRANLQLPSGFNAAETSPQNWRITGPDGQAFSDIALNEDGTISGQSLEALADKGVQVSDVLASSPLSGETQTVQIGQDTYVIPSEYTIKPIEGGYNWQILDEAGQPHGQLSINPDGSLTEESLAELEQNGIQVHVETLSESVQQTVQSTNLSAEQLIQNNADQTERVHRVLWYGNDTPNDYDLNELRTHAGGANGDWFDADGNVVLDISRMTPDGSFQGGQEANPFQLTGENRLSLAVSTSRGTQDTVFTFDFVTQPDGRTVAVIPPGSPAYQLFQAGNDHSGHGAFNGRYLEIMEMTGQEDEFGQQVRILGTYVGENSADGSLTDVVETAVPTERNVTTLTFTPPLETIQQVNLGSAIIAETNNRVVPVVPIPIRARRGLETPLVLSPQRRRYNYYHYGVQSAEEIDEIIEQSIPLLHENPEAQVPINQAVNWYSGLLRKHRSQAYIQNITSQIEASPTLANLGNSTTAIVTMPVAALVEGDHIYKTLSLYGQQSSAAQSATQVLLHVNWPEADGSTPEGAQKIAHLKAEIDRAQADFPDLRIATVESQWQPEDLNGGVIGHVVRKLYDTAILSVKKAVDEGRMDPDHEVVIIRNDADAKGISHDYVERMTDAVTRNGVDASVGRFKWGIEQVEGLPGFAITTQVFEGIRGSIRRAREKGIDVDVQTAGANTGIRLSTLAAIGSIGFSAETGAGSDDLAVGRRIKAIRRSDSPVRNALYRRGRNGRSARTYGATTTMGGGTITIANGATIDTDPSRLEALYRSGKSIGEAWNDFDEGGFKPRTASMPAIMDRESFDDFDSIAGRIEFQITSMVNEWWVDPRHAEMEFRRSFPSNKPGEEPMYVFTTDADGKMEFKFTDSGKKLLAKRLTRNNRGRYDRLGSRRVRVNYGRTPKNGKIQAPRVPRLVGAQS